MDDNWLNWRKKQRSWTSGVLCCLFSSNSFVLSDELLVKKKEKDFMPKFGQLWLFFTNISLFLCSLLTGWKLVGHRWKKVSNESTSDESWWVIFGLCQSYLINLKLFSKPGRGNFRFLIRRPQHHHSFWLKTALCYTRDMSTLKESNFSSLYQYVLC